MKLYTGTIEGLTYAIKTTVHEADVTVANKSGEIIDTFVEIFEEEHPPRRVVEHAVKVRIVTDHGL